MSCRNLFAVLAGIPSAVALLPCLLLSNFAGAQLPASVVEIQGRILEQGAQTQPLPNIKVWVNNKAYLSDRYGVFALKLPFSEDRISLHIQPNGYKILKPFNGEVYLDPSVTVFQLEIFVVQQRADAELVEAANELEARLLESQRRHQLSNRQLSRINDILLDTLLFFDRQKQAFHQQINQLNAELARTEAAAAALTQDLRKAQDRLAMLEAEVELLSRQLFVALEEKFLRQQAIFDQVSSALNNYLLRSRDLNDVLARLNEYFPMNYSPSGSQAYNQAVESYNTVFVLLHGKRDEFSLGVAHYWESELVSHSLAATFNILFEDVHQSQFLPVLTEINSHLRQNKRKAALKAGGQATLRLSPQLDRLEAAIEQSIALLKNSI